MLPSQTNEANDTVKPDGYAYMNQSLNHSRHNLLLVTKQRNHGGRVLCFCQSLSIVESELASDEYKQLVI